MKLLDRLVAIAKSLRYPPPVGLVRWGSLRRVRPIGPSFGYNRGGTRIGRYYIENFLRGNQQHVAGRVLEIADDKYTRAYGGARVTQGDVLHVEAGAKGATIIGDLVSGANIPEGQFDCIIITQTIEFIYDFRAALGSIHRALKPGGVLMLTCAGVAHQISRYDMDRWGDYWRFTSLSLRRSLETHFASGDIQIESHGNVLAACAFLHGISAEELRSEELNHRDPDFEVILTAIARKK